MKQHKVPDSVQPVGVARYLSRAWPQMPGWVIRNALKEKNVRLNGARATAEMQVRGGDELNLYIEEKYFGGALTVLYVDDHLLVLEKPVGLPVDSDTQAIGEDTLLRRARSVYPSAQLCHRLDTGTGGVLLCALKESVKELIKSAFSRGEIRKTYRAVLCGRPAREKNTLDDYLAKDAASARVRIVSQSTPGAKRASLTYHLLDTIDVGSLPLSRVEIDLHTGRTHQIRVQMAQRGMPVLGDDKYGDRERNKAFRAAHPQLWCTQMGITSDQPILSAYRDMIFRSEDPFTLDRWRIEK